MSSAPTFPKHSAMTRRFTLGVPHSFRISPDGRRILFLRTATGSDPCQRLWLRDIATRDELVLADPHSLVGADDDASTGFDRDRKERARIAATGIIDYATDHAVHIAAFSLAGELFVSHLATKEVVGIPQPRPVSDPRPSPDGTKIAYVSDGGVFISSLQLTASATNVIQTDCDHVAHGVAEHIAAEEMGRHRGYWWSPDSDRLLVTSVDTSLVPQWWISDPGTPARPPRCVPYPHAGSPNADVGLHLVDLDGRLTEVQWDRHAFPYLARAAWDPYPHPILLVQSRDQRRQRIVAIDVTTGQTQTLATEADATWLDLLPGSPVLDPDGRLVRIVSCDDTRALEVGGIRITDGTLHVRTILHVDTRSVLFSATAGEEAPDPEVGETHVYEATGSGITRLSRQPGVHTATANGGITVLTSHSLDPRVTVEVYRDGERIDGIRSYAESPRVIPKPHWHRIPLAASGFGRDRIPTAVLLPEGYTGDEPLPVLMDPYGGPHGRRVTRNSTAYLEAQWIADQGFAVVIADGRGTPCNGLRYEQAIAGDFTLALDDQVDALTHLASVYPLDTGRVAIRGWSFGGYLAAMAVMRRPDVFHAAIAGAPVTDWRLYDTHYTERYLGVPSAHADVYAANSLVGPDGLGPSKLPGRPLMLIHGVADDNVVFAHSLRLSEALFEAGRMHEFVVLPSATHMAKDPAVAANLLEQQVAFLRRNLVPTESTDAEPGDHE